MLVLLGTAAVFIWSVALEGQRDGLLKVYFLDVGQGDAIFIETPSGNQMLIDGGPTDMILSRLGDVMPYYDTSIDIVALTHPQDDHLTGLIPVLKKYDVEMFIHPGAVGTSASYRELERVMGGLDMKNVEAAAGMRIHLDDEVYMDIYAPYEKGRESDNLNEIMLIGKLHFRDASLILTGDAEKIDEINLASSNADLESDVLKVSHHGSKNSSTALFLERVSPQLAIISSGVNRYGHPHADAIERLRAAGAEVRRTDQEGTITLVSDGNAFLVVRQ